jgi:glycosyltransferase involved in cell wall biosynthesis
MKISIITATYNSAFTVRDSLDCIARQTHPDIEHIIVDALSKDATLEIVKQFPHVSKTISEKDNGLYDAMNKGVQMATGEVIGILNSDDFYTSEKVLAMVAEAFADPSVEAVYGDLQYVRQDDISKVIRTWKAGHYKKSFFYYGWMPPHPTFFVRRNLYNRAGLFNTALRTSADYELMLRMMVKHNANVRYIPEVLVKMRDGGLSNASLGNRLRANREDHEAWKLNGLKPFFFTRWLKPLRKVFQFINR